MKAVIHIGGIVGKDTVLLDVIREFKSFANPTEVEVHIDSVGGCVDTGLSIFNYLRNLDLPVTTIATKAYSIAASIFMAGDERIVEDGEAKVMIHMPWAEVQGDSKRLESVAKELKSIEKDFITFYSTYTSIDAETIKNLLQNQTFLSGDEAFTLGFATLIKTPLKAVALYPSQEKNNTMTKTEKFLKALNDFFKSETETEINALKVQDSNGTEVGFPELDEGIEPSVGDKAEIDGKPAEGEIIATNGDTWLFEAGELKEIIPAEPEAEPTVETEDVEANAEVIKEIMKWDVDVDNTSFEIGEIVKYTYEDVEYSIGAGEFGLADGRKIITNADGEIVKVIESSEDSEPEVETVEPDAEASGSNVEIEGLVKSLTENFTKQNDNLKAEINALKKLVGSEDVVIVAEQKKTNTNNYNNVPDSLKGLLNLRKK